MSARVLVIEDNPANLELITYLLKVFGHQPLVAVDGEEGLAVARKQVPDLIICDVQLPKLDGFGVARALKQDPFLRHIPLVAVTAYAMVGDRDRMLASGFDGYIAKPIAPEFFVGQVEAFLPASFAGAGKNPVGGAPRRTEPAVAQGGEQREPALADLASGQRKRPCVLVVDDVDANRELLRSLLVPSGYDFIEARGVEEALALGRQQRPDLVLVDVHLGAESGFALLKAIQADPALSSTPVVMTSATGGALGTAEARSRANGAAGFLQWPIEAPVLTAAVEQLVASAPKE